VFWRRGWPTGAKANQQPSMEPRLDKILSTYDGTIPLTVKRMQDLARWKLKRSIAEMKETHVPQLDSGELSVSGIMSSNKKTAKRRGSAMLGITIMTAAAVMFSRRDTSSEPHIDTSKLTTSLSDPASSPRAPTAPPHMRQNIEKPKP